MQSAEVVTLFNEDPTPDLEAAFATFWSHCLVKVDKPIARARFMAICTSGLDAKNRDRETDEIISVGILKATPDELIEGMKRYSRSKLDADFKRSKFIQHPATWLNRGGWMND